MGDLPPPNRRSNETTHLRPFGGSVERKTVLERRGLPMDGSVKVDRLGTDPQRFAVTAAWHGPPLPLPDQPVKPQALVDAVDELVVNDYPLAVAIARAAADELQHPRVPDLRALRARFTARTD